MRRLMAGSFPFDFGQGLRLTGFAGAPPNDLSRNKEDKGTVAAGKIG